MHNMQDLQNNWRKMADIAALVPQYTDGGDHVRVLTTDGETVPAAVGIKALVRRILRKFCIDIVTLRRRVAIATTREQLQPLPLMPGLVLCPVRVRTPRVKGDPTIGYINSCAVTRVLPGRGRGAVVEFAGGLRLPVLFSARAVNKLLSDARLAAHEAMPGDPILNFSFPRG